MDPKVNNQKLLMITLIDSQTLKANDDLTNLSKKLKAIFNHKVSIKARSSVYLSTYYSND
ncbi:MAG: hypothetical protein CSA42_00870 [Gammaproteobacteria bacterium]|nr:MAG: hypothetical protein CSA42_00870 [Gammaproteobacteria bacterium]